MAIGYANNLLYFFVFFLISMALTGMLVTNKNVDLFQIHRLQADHFFANTESRVDLLVSSRDHSKPIWDIEVGLIRKETFWMFNKNASHVMKLIEEVQFEKLVAFHWVPERRGRYSMPRLQIESKFPFRMLRAWKYYDETTEFFVYPERKGVEQIPTRFGSHSENESDAQAKDEGLFRDFREFQKSDPPQRIDWKRSLKHQKHLVKNFETSGDKKIYIDWEMTASLNGFEERISQIALWIDLCHRRKETYCLKIKKFETEYGSQNNHYKLCMEKLALLKEEEVYE